MIVSWWSAGVTSAVATKLAIDEYGVDNVLPIYFHIDTAHKDNARFKAECEQWYGKEIVTHKAAKYNNQFDVIRVEWGTGIRSGVIFPMSMMRWRKLNVS